MSFVFSLGGGLLGYLAQVVGNLLLLDSEGKRIAVQYFSPEWWVGTEHPACI